MFLSTQRYQVKVHQPRPQLRVLAKPCVLCLLAFAGKQESEAVLSVISQWYFLIVGIHNKETAAGLVASIYEPRLDELHQFAAYAPMGEVYVDAQAANKYPRVAAHMLGMRYIAPHFLLTAIRKCVHTDAVVGKSKRAYNDRQIIIQPETIALTQHLPAIKRSIMPEELVQVGVTARERAAFSDDIIVQRRETASVQQESHTYNILTFLNMARAISTCLLKSVFPLFR